MAAKNKDNCGNDRFDDWWEDRSIPQKVLLVIGFIILGAGLLFLFGFIVRALWNWLMPDIFGLKQITYWQAWGLIILSSILFKPMNMKSESGKTDRKRKKKLRSYMSADQAVDLPPEGGEQSEAPQV